MKILLATDGSPCSAACIHELQLRPWPPETDVRVLVANPSPEAAARELATEIAADTAGLIRERVPGFPVTVEVREEPPRAAIVRAAEEWGADLILVGSHGYGPMRRMVLGSVAQAVALSAPCSVEIVRPRRALAREARGSLSLREGLGMAVGAAALSAHSSLFGALAGTAMAGPMGTVVGGLAAGAVGAAVGAGVGLVVEHAMVEPAHQPPPDAAPAPLAGLQIGPP